MKCYRAPYNDNHANAGVIIIERQTCALYRAHYNCLINNRSHLVLTNDHHYHHNPQRHCIPYHRPNHHLSFQEVNWDEQWDPRIYFFNAVNIDKMQTNHYILPNEDDDPNGVPDVRLSIRMKGTFKCSMQLKDFPFDCQVRRLRNNYTSIIVILVL